MGIDRAVGGVDHRNAAPRRRDDDARVGPPPPVRDRRRELPHRLLRRGTTCAATRATRGGRTPTRAPSARRRSPAPRDGGWFLRASLGIADRSFGRRHYDDSRTWFRAEEDFPGPRTMPRLPSLVAPRVSRPTIGGCCSSTSSIRTNRSTRPSRGRRCTTTSRATTTARLIWPPYIVGGSTTGAITEAQARQIRNNYGAKLSMIDHWFGTAPRRTRRSGPVGHDRRHRVHRPRPLPRRRTSSRCAGRRHGGRHLGQADGPAVRTPRPHAAHDPLARASRAGRPRSAVDALTTNVDLNATIADVFGVERGASHARAIAACRCSTARPTSIRDWAIGGVYGNWVQVTDGRRKYARAPVDDNFPLSMWSNRWSTMPVHKGLADFMRFPNPDRRATLDFMPGSDVPVIRQPFEAGDLLPFWVGGASSVGSTTVRPRRRSRRSREPPRRAARAEHGRSAADGARSRSRRLTSNSPGSGWPERQIVAAAAVMACLVVPTMISMWSSVIVNGGPISRPSATGPEPHG